MLIWETDKSSVQATSDDRNVSIKRLLFTQWLGPGFSPLKSADDFISISGNHHHLILKENIHFSKKKHLLD